MGARTEFSIGTRAASTPVGVVLLTAVVVVTSTLVGGFVISNVGDQVTGSTLMECEIEYDDGSVHINHMGGDPVASSSLTVVFRNASGTTGAGFEVDTGDGGLFEPGEAALYGSLARTTDISLVTENSVLCSETLERATAGPTGTATPSLTPTPTATPTPSPSSTLAGYRLQDTTDDSTTDYELFYDVDNTVEFDRVEVAFDNRNNDWGDQTVIKTAERGSVTFSQGGQEGSTYDITVEVYDSDGTVTDSVSIVDTANSDSQSSGDVTEGTSPSFDGTAVDDLGGPEANYEVSYNVTDRSQFGSVEVRYENLDNEWASKTYTSTEVRTNVDDYALADSGGTDGDEYRITVFLYDTDGVIVDERVVTDVADGTDPSGNADLSRVTSPTVDSYSIRDRTKNNNGDYQVQYRVSNPNSDFSEVDIVFDNLDDPYASASRSDSNENGNIRFQRGGIEGDTYDITIRVRDSDGIVADERVVTDTADGTDP